MITKVTKENKALYNAWFEKARNDSQNEAITSLDAYFAVITQLANIDPIFTVLPLDKPTFDINANSRTIKVPEEYKKNGVSVQGDEIAEIIYFSVDRYFDSVDLYDEDIRIAIQWEGASHDRVNGLQGVSSEHIRDITTRKAEDKMIFGWALNSDITKYPGTIKFAVRFYKLQTGDDGQPEITFSLSTLTQSATINPALDFTIKQGNFDAKVYNDSAKIKNRLKNSVTPSELDIALSPYFLVNLPTEGELEDIWGTVANPENEDKPYGLIDLQTGRLNEANEPTVDGYAFKVQATSDDAGVIGYQWYRQALDSQIEGKEDGVMIYERTNDTHYSSAHPYYLKNEDKDTGLVSWQPYIVPSNLLNQVIEDEDAAKLYERYSKYDMTKTGYYRVEAINYKGVSSKALESNLIKVPGPEPLELVYEASQANTLLDTNGQATITMKGVTGQNGDKITYTWDDPDDGAEGAIQTHTTEQNVEDTFAIAQVAETNRASYDNTFKVDVYAARNGDKTPVQTVEFRVTDPAHELVVTVPQETIKKPASRDAVLKVEVTNPYGVVSDEVRYDWYRALDINEDEELTDFTNDEQLHAHGSEYVTKNQGAYYCNVTNVVNGSEKTVRSNLILVVIV